jgi:hypothetical protein
VLSTRTLARFWHWRSLALTAAVMLVLSRWNATFPHMNFSSLPACFETSHRK